ncbi:MAG: CoA transferase subunit A [Thiovulaceae bacterium]|nr:CoA transferase subunit A [Sulfurimonadaceae bacterium]
MKNKLISLTDAVSKVKDGMTIMVGGFLSNGSPNKLMNALVESGVKNLILISNDTSFPEIGQGKLVANRQVKKVITSHVGTNPVTGELMNSGELEVEFSPQGTLAERIRAYGAGLGGILTTTGLGTSVENGKVKLTINNIEYLLETPLKADIAFIGASVADKSGNLYYKGNSRNFNPLMAMAADIVIVETEELVETGEIKPENVHTSGIFVDYIHLK